MEIIDFLKGVFDSIVSFFANIIDIINYIIDALVSVFEYVTNIISFVTSVTTYPNIPPFVVVLLGIAIFFLAYNHVRNKKQG